MEDYIFKTLVFSLVSLVLYPVLRVINVYWWRPRSLEKQLRQQGIQGRSYRLFEDDMKEISTSSKEAWSRPMTLNHQIAPRVFPFFYQMVQNYGKVSLSWIETRPRLIIADPELIKLILADKNGHIIKPPLNPLVNLRQLGVTTLEGGQWAKRRRLIIPAFHLEKFKRDGRRMMFQFSKFTQELIKTDNRRQRTPLKHFIEQVQGISDFGLWGYWVSLSHKLSYLGLGLGFAWV